MSSRIRKRKFCAHCQQTVSASTYYAHRLEIESTISKNEYSITEEGEERLVSHSRANISDDEFNGESDTSTRSELDISSSENFGCIDEIESDSEGDGIEIWNRYDCLPDDDFNNDIFARVPTTNNTIMNAVLQAIFLLQANMFLSDSTVQCVLGVMRLFIFLLYTLMGLLTLQTLLEDFPSSIYMARKMIGINRDSFIKYVVCPKCDMLYKYSDCVATSLSGKKQSKKCTNVLFPKHTYKSHRTTCNELLMKSVFGVDGKTVHLYPKKVYAYRSVKESLKELLKKPDFIELLFSEPAKRQNNTRMTDIVHGKLWQDFTDSKGDSFFRDKRNLACMLNLDCFHPYKNSEYSMGALYLSILNVPREHRFKWENTIVVGIIPGQSEPSVHINSYLKPLVDELLLFWDGQFLKEKSDSVIYKLAVFAISNDIPATRKFGGFISHNATKGCSKCLKEFKKNKANLTNYSGYDIDSWEERIGLVHKELAAKTMTAATPTAKKEMETMYGASYSELHRLPYFDPVRMHTIDPMHNLFLGIAKHVFIKWIDAGVLDDKKLINIDDKMAVIKVPTDVGRIPGKISKCYKRMKADEWKNWTMIYSSYCLRGVIPLRHSNMWSIFVAVCHLICKRSICINEINEAHVLMRMFCNTFEQLLGELQCSPNMHLSLHLKSCILDLGPVYSFWCFSYERFNGILGSYHLNNHSISVQVMRKLLAGNQVRNLKFITVEGFSYLNTPDIERSFSTKNSEIQNQKIQTYRDTECIGDVDLFECGTSLSVMKHASLLGSDYTFLEKLLNVIYTTDKLIRISNFVPSMKRVMLGNEIFSNHIYRLGRSHNSLVLARYLGRTLDLSQKIIRPAIIKGLYEVSAVFRSGTKTFKIAELTWYKEHREGFFFGRNSPLSIWCMTFEDSSVAPLVPLQFFHGRHVTIKERMKFSNYYNDDVNIVIKLPSRSF